MTKKKTKIDYWVSLEKLLEAGSHFGHQTQRWNSKMAPYIWKAKEGVHIFDLAQTAEKLKEACLAVEDLVSQGKKIVFVGTKRQAQAIIKEEAEKLGIPHVTNRWLGGTLTNWQQIKKSLDRLKEMEEKKEKGEYDKYTKKENILIQREINRLRRIVGGLRDLEEIPDALFIVDCRREKTAFKEAKDKGLLVFAIVDSNCDPEGVDHLIPANDDAVRSIKLIVEKFSEAVNQGLQLAEKKGKTKKSEDQDKKKEKK